MRRSKGEGFGGNGRTGRKGKSGAESDEQAKKVERPNREKAGEKRDDSEGVYTLYHL